MLKDQGDPLGAESLDLEELERAGRKLLQQLVAPLVGASLDDLGDHQREAFADAWHLGDLAGGVAEDVDDALGQALDGRRAVAVAADAEAVVPVDLHQVGGFPENARDFLVFQEASGLLYGGAQACSNSVAATEAHPPRSRSAGSPAQCHPELHSQRRAARVSMTRHLFAWTTCQESTR